MFDWKSVAAEVAARVPSTHRVPMTRVMSELPPKLARLVRKVQPQFFFSKNADLFEVTEHSGILATEFGQNRFHRFLRRKNQIAREKDSDPILSHVVRPDAELYPEYMIPPRMVLALAYALPSNFVPVEAVQARVAEAVPGLWQCPYPLAAICAMFPDIIDVVVPESEVDSVRVRSKVSTFESTGKVPAREAEEILMHSIKVAGPLTLASFPLERHREIICSLMAMPKNAPLSNVIDAFLQRHTPAYFYKGGRGFYANFPPVLDPPPIPWVTPRLPGRAVVERWVAAASPTQLEIVSEPKGFVEVQDEDDRSWKVKDKVAKTLINSLKSELGGEIPMSLIYDVADRVIKKMNPDQEYWARDLIELFSEKDYIIALYFAKRGKGHGRGITNFFKKLPDRFVVTQNEETLEYLIRAAVKEERGTVKFYVATESNKYYEGKEMIQAIENAFARRGTVRGEFASFELLSLFLTDDARKALKFHRGIEEFVLNHAATLFETKRSKDMILVRTR